MFYSKSVGGFIPDEWMTDGTYDPVPVDAINVTEREIVEFQGVCKPGKIIDVKNGRLAWVDAAPPSSEEIIAQTKHMRDALIAESSQIIGPMKDALDGGYIEGTDIPALTAWQKYRYELTKVDLVKPIWPEKPE